MGHHRCLGCDVITGIPASHPLCHGVAPTWEVCTCGSGAHPRRCELHPKAFAEHVDHLNALGLLDAAEDDMRAAGLVFQAEQLKKLGDRPRPWVSVAEAHVAILGLGTEVSSRTYPMARELTSARRLG